VAWVVAAVVTAGAAGHLQLDGPLPALPDRARAWKVGDSVDAARVATLAAALGLHGQPRQEPSGWTVRDGRRALVVHRLAGVPWSYGSGIFGACVTRAGGGPYRPGAGIQCLDPDAPVSNQPGAGATGRPVAPARAVTAAHPPEPGRGRAGRDRDRGPAGSPAGPGRRPGGGKPAVAYLLPAYLFDLEGGWTDVRAIIAVPDRYLTRP
jgi:hypothetical protein